MDFTVTRTADRDALASWDAGRALDPQRPIGLPAIVAHARANARTPDESQRIPKLLDQLARLIEGGHVRVRPENPAEAPSIVFLALGQGFAPTDLHPVDHAVHTAARSVAAAGRYPTLGAIDHELNVDRGEMARVGAAEVLRAIGRLHQQAYLSIGERMPA